jgi:hypothetical protein
MESSGYAMRWMREERMPVAATLWRMVGYFSTCGMGTRRCV